MNKEEYIKKAKELGYTNEMIKEDIKIVDEALKDGIKMEYGQFLMKLPVDC